jgi:hypothetical protein
MTAFERLQKKLKEEDSLKAEEDALKAKATDVSGVLKSLRKGEPTHLDKRKALAQLAYGNPIVVDRERIKANRYREEKGLPPLDMDPVLVEPTDNPTGGSQHDPNTMVIKNRTEQSVARPSRINGYLGGEIKSPVEILGHEMTHAMTGPDWERDYALGRARPRRWGSHKDVDYVPIGQNKTNEELNNARVTYPEYNPREFAPPLAAMTRAVYLQTGERIDTPEKFDKIIADYDAMSPEEKSAFKKNISSEVSRFYNYLDVVSDPKAKDIRLWGTEGDKQMPVRLEGKERRKRFLDISREMIPSLVEKEDSFEEAINRRMS